MRIAHVITRLVEGGASRVLLNVVEGLSDRHSFAIIAGREGSDAEVIEKIPDAVELHFVDSLQREISPRLDFQALVELFTFLRNKSYDVVHTHTSKAGLVGRVASYFAPGAEVVHSTHGLIYQAPDQIPGVPKSSLKLELIKLSEKLAGTCQSRLTTLSRAEKEKCVELGLAEAENTVAIPNGIDLSRFKPSPEGRSKTREELGINPDQVLVISAGRLSKEKGFETLVEAFAGIAEKHSEAALAIAGRGPAKPELESKIENLGLEDRAQLTGHVDEVVDFLAAGDVFVLPSLYEGFGLVLLEAMAVGLPVIASRTGGTPELVEPDKNGLLFPPGDAEKLTEELNHLTGNPDRRSELASSARSRAKEYSSTSMVERYDELYRSLSE